MIEVHVEGLRELFDTLDPSPFRKKDLDPRAEEFIVSWAREVPRGTPLALTVYIDRFGETAADVDGAGEAIRTYFAYRAEMSRRRLRQLFRIGRVSLLVGLVFVAALLGLSDLIPSGGRRIGEVVRESLIIVGWVALWRPLEIFLYDWWPIRAEARLYDRLTAMPVRFADALPKP